MNHSTTTADLDLSMIPAEADLLAVFPIDGMDARWAIVVAYLADFGGHSGTFVFDTEGGLPTIVAAYPDAAQAMAEALNRSGWSA